MGSPLCIRYGQWLHTHVQRMTQAKRFHDQEV